MTKHDDYQRQLEFEDTCKLRAKQKFRRDNHKMRYEMQGGYASGTPAGRSMSENLFKFIYPFVQEAIDAVPKRKHVTEVQSNAFVLCSLIGVEKVTGITIKCLIDIIGRQKSNIRATEVITKIGNRLMTEYIRTQWEENYPKQFQDLENKYRHAGIWHKLKAMSAIFGRHYEMGSAELKAKLGGNYVTATAGSLVLEPIFKHTDWFEKSISNVSANKQQTFIDPTPAFDQWFEEYHGFIEERITTAYPMICPPRDWNNMGYDGGYLNPVEKHLGVLKDIKGVGSRISPKQLEYINKTLQPVAWEINPFVSEVQEALFRTPGGCIDSFRPISFHPLTNEAMPDHISALPMDHPARIEWRREKALINAANAESRRKGVRTVRNMAAKRLLEKETLYIPWSIGHNGRCYPLSQGALSPQGADAEKSLLRFAEASPVTPQAEYWLAIHMANSYGVTESHEAKLEWVEANQELIKAIATEPLDHIESWEGTDDPWQFLAAVDEYYHCVVVKDRLETKLPVSCDATASGLQILALLGRDVACAEQVNLLPHTTKKMDIYSKLKKVTQELLIKKGRKDLSRIYIPRKGYKTALVSRIYGSYVTTRNKTLRKVLFEAHNHQLGLIDAEDLMLISKTIEEAMWQVAPQALNLFDTLRSIGAHCAKENKPAQWTTPVGNLVVVNPTKHTGKRIPLGWLGRLRIADDNEPAQLVTNKVRSSFAPLLIHSLDAAVLVEAFHEWRLPISSTHDCFSVRATDMDDALKAILTAYKTILKDGKQFLTAVAETNGTTIDVEQGDFTDEMFDDLPNLSYAFC